MMYRNLLVLVVIFVLSTFHVSSILIENNAYKGVSISFSESVHESSFDFEKLKSILVRSSELLYLATKKRSYFGEFVVSLPPTWTGDACGDFTNDAPSKVDFHLTDRTDEATLTTRHSGGCGKEGDIVYMPLHWMKGATEDLASQFVKQWSIYRYGVFEEDPIKDGSCFISRNAWSPAGCYNLKIDVEPTFENGVPVCSLPSDFFEKNKLKSSLMSQSNSSKVLNFCDGSELYPHNPAIPTLHNNLCEGKTVWSVIEMSEDFKYAQNLPLEPDKPPSPPSFKCFKERPMQVTFAIQNSTSKEDLSAAMVELGYSLYQFLGNMLPSVTKANAVMFSDDEDNSKPVELDLSNSFELEKTIGFYVRTIKVVANTCLQCGLQKALKASLAYNHPSPIVVLIAWESSLVGEKPSLLVESVRSYLPKVRLHLILVEDTDAEVLPSSLVDAVRTTGGNIYSLPNELVFMASKLHVVLAGVVKNHLQIEDNIVVVHESTYENITENFIDSFSTPRNIAAEKLLYNMYCDLGRIVQEKNPNCSFEKSASTTFKCGEVRSFTEQVKSPHITSMRTWEYPFEYQGGTTLPNCSSVAMLLVPLSSKRPPTLRGWLSKYQINTGQDALIIYAEISVTSDKRILVFATVSSSVLLSPITIELLDNGNGDPDVKAGDGIYSRYFSSFTKKGTYVVSISTEVSNKNSNSFSKTDHVKTVSKFVQKKIIGSFSVNQDAPEIDVLPPNRIVDLSVVSIDHENRTVTLQWTAPGNDYDSGKASAYEIKYSEHSAGLSEMYFKDEEDAKLMFNNYSLPSDSGTKEILEYFFPNIIDNGLAYYVALRGIDANQNKGKISNIVQVYFNKSVKIVTGTHTSSTENPFLGSTVLPENENHTKDDSNITEQSSTENPEITTIKNSSYVTLQPPENDNFFDKKTIIVISSAAGILLAIIIINFIVCCFCIKKKKNYPDKQKLCKQTSLRPPYNLNISYQEDSNSQTDNDAGVSMSTLQDRSTYSESNTRNRTRQRYTYHTDKSLRSQEQSPTSSELGFKLVQTLPTYATPSLSRFTAKLNDLDSETDTDTNPSASQSQKLSNIDDAHIYSLGVV